MEYIEKSFGDVIEGTNFYIWSDCVINETPTRWIECVKLDKNTAQELDGCRFFPTPTTEVFILIEEII